MAVFLVVSEVSPRPIDPARLKGVSYTRCQDKTYHPMQPLISIVDDDNAVRDALQRMLASHGFATAGFASAERFLSRPKSRRTSCLILDARMPGMTGLALHSYLIAAGCRLPTILITACPTSGERRRAIAGGVAAYLAKPLREQVLLDTIRRTLEDDGRADGATRLSGPDGEAGDLI
jgi:FixJ family two-component response regulator